MSRELFGRIREDSIEVAGFLDGLFLSQTDDGSKAKLSVLHYKIREAIRALKELENQKEGRIDLYGNEEFC